MEESAHVKEAFQKLEQLTCALEQKSEDFSQNLHKLEKVSENTDKVIMAWTENKLVLVFFLHQADQR